jgi:hypothetical protein
MGPVGIPELFMIAGPFAFAGLMLFALYWVIRAAIRAERQK